MQKFKTISHNNLPKNLKELQENYSSYLTDPAYTVYLTLAALEAYNTSPEDCFEMLNYLKGPEQLSEYAKQFIKERMANKADYIVKSYFNGAVPANDYTPVNYSLDILESPNSFSEENYAILYVKSGGADSPRPVHLRKKPSTGEWFLLDQMLLADIVVPKSSDPWA